MTLAPGDSAILTIMFRGAPDSGVYTANYEFVDDCGVSHSIIEHVFVQPSLSLSCALATNTGATIINDTPAVFLISNSSSIPAGVYSFTISNESTALLFDSAASAWGAISVTQITPDSLVLTLQLSQPSGSDTLAILWYYTFIGATYTPYINLTAESSMNRCLALNGVNTVVLSLTPACPLD